LSWFVKRRVKRLALFEDAAGRLQRRLVVLCVSYSKITTAQICQCPRLSFQVAEASEQRHFLFVNASRLVELPLIGKENAKWQAATHNPNSTESKILAKLNGCTENVSRSAYQTVE